MLQTAADKLQRDGLQLQLLVDGKLVNATSAQLVDAWLQFYGAYQMVVMFGCLAMARYWQATLYNPGGFRQEFHQLRLDPRLMAAILVLMALAVQDITPVNDWLFMLCLLPFVQGMAVVHYAVAARNAGTAWLVLAYLMMLLLPPTIVLLGVIDSVVNVRKRMAAKMDKQI